MKIYLLLIAVLSYILPRDVCKMSESLIHYLSTMRTLKTEVEDCKALLIGAFMPHPVASRLKGNLRPLELAIGILGADKDHPTCVNALACLHGVGTL